MFKTIRAVKINVDNNRQKNIENMKKKSELPTSCIYTMIEIWTLV